MRDSLDQAGGSTTVHWAPLCSRRATTQDPRAVAAASAAYALIKVDLASDQLVVPSHVRAADVAQWQQNRRPKRRYLGAGSAFSPICVSSGDESAPDSDDSDANRADDSSCVFSDDCSDAERADVDAPAGPRLKLWTAKQFPMGYSAGYVSSMDNLRAAQDDWSCPCADRRNCIGAERVDIFKLYEFRKAFHQQTGTASRRDAMRKELQCHYDRGSAKFTRSFVVANCGDCCAAAAGLARGISVDTFERARADARRDHGWHADRANARKASAPPPRPPFMMHISPSLAWMIRARTNVS